MRIDSPDALERRIHPQGLYHDLSGNGAIHNRRGFFNRDRAVYMRPSRLGAGNRISPRGHGFVWDCRGSYYRRAEGILPAGSEGQIEGVIAYGTGVETVHPPHAAGILFRVWHRTHSRAFPGHCHFCLLHRRKKDFQTPRGIWQRGNRGGCGSGSGEQRRCGGSLCSSFCPGNSLHAGDGHGLGGSDASRSNPRAQFD